MIFGKTYIPGIRLVCQNGDISPTLVDTLVYPYVPAKTGSYFLGFLVTCQKFEFTYDMWPYVFSV